MGTSREKQLARQAEEKRLAELMRQHKGKAESAPPVSERTAKRMSSRDHAFYPELISACKRTRLLEDRLAFPQYGRQGHNTYAAALQRIALYQRSQVRELSDWRCRTHNAGRQFASLVRHLFARYGVPPFMDSVWFRESDGWITWFIAVGQGKNIRQVDDFTLPFTKKMAHHMMQSPATFTIEEAMRYGQILGLGGDDRAFAAVLETTMPGPEQDTHHHAFWATVLQWFVNHPMLDTAHYGPIVDYIRHRKFVPVGAVIEDNRVVRRGIPDPEFSMKGRTVEALLRDVDAWHGHLGKTGRRQLVTWKPCGRDWQFVQKSRKEVHIWTVKEVTNSYELAEEGRCMRHCVYTYLASCVRRHSAIFSLRCDDERRLTVELRLPDLAIRQARGKSNRLPTAEEQTFLARWLRACSEPSDEVS